MSICKKEAKFFAIYLLVSRQINLSPFSVVFLFSACVRDHFHPIFRQERDSGLESDAMSRR